MRKKLIITTAVLFMVGGLWWQFKGSPSNASADPASPTTDTTTSTSSSEPADYYDQDDPTNPVADTIGDTETGQRNLATDEDLDRCVPVENGFGIQMKDWGKVRLPYADTWPKNEPGTPVDCAPETDFGAAVVAAHALFLESLSPELIPEIALATPGRASRIENHTLKRDPAELSVTCTPVGWDRPTQGIYVWLIYYQCGDGPIYVTPMRMQHDTGEWLMVYHFTGRISIEEAEPETIYFPFEGGD